MIINRRLLRVRVFQSLFSFKQQESSIKELYEEKLKLAFDVHHNTFGLDSSQLLAYEEKSLRVFNLLTKEELPQEIGTFLYELQRLSQKEIEKTKLFAVSDVLNKTYKLYQFYLLGLLILSELPKIADDDYEGRFIKKDLIHPKNFTQQNRVITLLKNHLELQAFLKKETIRISVEEKQKLKEIYTQNLRSSEWYIEYLKKEKTTIEDDIKVLRNSIKKILFKIPMWTDVWMEKDIFWAEHALPLENALLRTIKKVIDTQQIELEELSQNWKEDQEFVRNLYFKSIEKEAIYLPLIDEQLKNWKVERLALSDSILLSLALTEAIEYSNIPLKVTLNEYIELAKLYSTPQSGVFINGVLDVLFLKLKKENKIKKSGLGLIDNK